MTQTIKCTVQDFDRKNGRRYFDKPLNAILTYTEVLGRWWGELRMLDINVMDYLLAVPESRRVLVGFWVRFEDGRSSYCKIKKYGGGELTPLVFEVEGTDHIHERIEQATLN